SGPSPPARQRVLGTGRCRSAGSLSAICPHHKGTTPLLERGLPASPTSVIYAPYGCPRSRARAPCPPHQSSTKPQFSAIPGIVTTRGDLGAVTHPHTPVSGAFSERPSSQAAAVRPPLLSARARNH